MSQPVSATKAHAAAAFDEAAPPLPSSARDLVLLAARTLLGVVVMAHGLQKFLTNGLDGTATMFAGMGVPLPQVSAAASAGIETVGGALLILGLLTPVAGVLITAVMAGAFWFVHMGRGLFAADGGWELVAVIGLAALMLAVVGPGRFSLDALVRRHRR